MPGGARSCALPIPDVSGGRWYTLESGELRFDLARCRMRRFDDAEGVRAARKCLAGRSVVMIGQSWTRYAYMSLVHLIDKGEFPRAQPHESVCWEKSWSLPANASWPEWLRGTGLNESETDRYTRMWLNFFHRTSELFSSSGGVEVCDCSRLGFHSRHQENRYYERPADALRISYLQSEGRNRVLGHALPSKGMSMSEMQRQLAWCPAGVCLVSSSSASARRHGQAEAWSKDLLGLMRDVVAPLRPDVLLWSSDFGDWPSCVADDGVFSRVLEAGRAALAPGGKAFTKSRTPSRHGYKPYPPPSTLCFGGICGGLRGVPPQYEGRCFRAQVCWLGYP